MIGLIILMYMILSWLIFAEIDTSSKVPNSTQAGINEIKSQKNEPVILNDGPALETSVDFLPEPLPQLQSEARNADTIEKAWESQLNSILMQEIEIKEIAQKIFVILPTLPLDGQLEAAQHLVNLSGDEDYSAAEAVYFNTGLNPAVRRIVFEDLMNRPNAVRLPLLVRTLREYGHPMQSEAKENLQSLTGQNEGNDPARWDAVVKNALEEERKSLQDGENAPE